LFDTSKDRADPCNKPDRDMETRERPTNHAWIVVREAAILRPCMRATRGIERAD
jgi:hypothetical protein